MAVVERHSADVNVDGVWYADDEAREKDKQDSELRSSLITPYSAHLRKPAITHNLSSSFKRSLLVSQSVSQPIKKIIYSGLSKKIVGLLGRLIT